MNWMIENRKALGRDEFEKLTKRVRMFPQKIGNALARSKIDECFKELLIVNKELNELLLEIKKRYHKIGKLENDIEACFTEFTNILNDYH